MWFRRRVYSRPLSTGTGEANSAGAELEWTRPIIHRLSIAEACDNVASSAQGLSSVEAARRLRDDGPNRIPKALREPALVRLIREFFRFFSVILWVAAGLCFVSDWADPGQSMAHVGFAVVGVILISGAFSFWQEYRIERTLTALQKLLPQQAKAWRDGSVHELPVEQLVVGDVVALEQGANIPADCRLIEAFAVKVNTATITGELITKSRDANPAPQSDLVHSRNIVLAGTSIVAGEAKALVYATGSRTEFGRIAHLTQTSRTTVSPLRRELAHLSRFIAGLAITIGSVFFAIGAAIGVPLGQDFIFSIGIIVAMVPEGLLPTLTLALVLAAQRMVKRRVLIRNLTSVETLGATTVICTDKTGTLTENRMVVRELLLGERQFSVEDADSIRAVAAQHGDFFRCLNFCHEVKELNSGGSTTLLGDPMEVAQLEMHRKLMGGLAVSKRLDEVPFDSSRMRQSVIHETPEGPQLYCKGAPERVLALCTRQSADGEVREFDDASREKIIRAHEEMTGRGLRVLALASRPLPPDWSHDTVEHDLVFDGLIALDDPPRPEVRGAIAKCRQAGIQVIMITGDHPRTAQAIAAQIGLVTPEQARVVTSDQLRTLSPSDLERAVAAPGIIFARVDPDDKMRIVEALKRLGHVVAVTGDGVNDAPALKSAHIGIAMGICGTDVAKEAADMVLLDDNFASIVNAVEEGRAVFQNIRKFLTYVLVHNVAELVPYLGFLLFGIPLALTPIQILLVDMGTDSLTALGLGVERPDPQAMRLPPRPPSERLLTGPLAVRAYLFLGLIEAGGAMAAFFLVLLTGGWSYGTTLAWNDPLYLRATTACLSAIIVLQVVNVFLCRSSVRSVFTMNVFGNPLVLWGVALELVLLAVVNYAPWANVVLGTAPVLDSIWVALVPSGIMMLALEELRKLLVRRKLRRQGNHEVDQMQRGLHAPR